jgi:hypothetical protein
MLKEYEEKLERNGYNRLLVLLRPAEPVWNQFTGVSSRLYIRYSYMCAKMSIKMMRKNK